MNKKKFQRLTALALCLIVVLGAFSISPMAADGASADAQGNNKNNGSSNSIYDTSGLLELLDLVSYEEYLKANEGANSDVERIDVDVIKDLFDKDDVKADGSDEKYVSDANFVIPGGDTLTKEDIERFNALNGTSLDTSGKNVGVTGVAAVITPGTGDVTWKVNVPADGRYILSIKYFALDDGMSNSVERAFKINGKTPFSEARYMTIKKNWVNQYEQAKYKGDNAEEVFLEADKLGFTGKLADDKKSFVLDYPKVWTSKVTDFCNKYSIRFFRIDIHGNELRPSAEQTPEWSDYTFCDSTGFYSEAFTFVLKEGDNYITFEGKNAALAISEMTLDKAPVLDTYKQYIEKYQGAPKGDGKVKIEGEYIEAASDNTIYALEDAADALTYPNDAGKTLLNVMGGEKWQTAGQWVTYSFKVDKSGMYDIVTRFRQNLLDGMFVNRALYIYSETDKAESEKTLEEGDWGYYNGVPFVEAKKLSYNYNESWQVTQAASQNESGKKTEFEFYFKEGVVYTIKFEVTLGDMGEVINTVQTALNAINNDYLSIIQLTGATPDTYRDYGFSRIMPDVLIDMVKQSKVLDNEDKNHPGVAQQLTELAGEKSSSVGTLQKVAQLLAEMGRDEDTIASSLDRLKSYIGTLGTFLSSAKTQPLEIDYVLVQAAGAKEPAAQANIFQTLWHEVCRFFWSFFRDYDSVGAMEKTTDESLNVWLATGRDQAQVKRNLVNNIFTQQTDITVELKLVAGGTLLPSILAQKGPDVYHGLGQGDVINYAIRTAILPIEDFGSIEYDSGYVTESFNDAKNAFNEAAMVVLKMEDADGTTHYYGLPEAQGFAMMFVRVDILAELGIDIPETWDDIMAAVPKLQSKNMAIGIPADANIHLYQMGGQLFADEGMRINLDSKIGLTSFTKMCEFFTKYGFPYSYDAANRFRTGEMPILIGDYTGLYNQLKVFATEIEGLWTMVPVPGTVQTDRETGEILYNEDGSKKISHMAVSSVSASVLVRGCKENKMEKAWTYIEWFTDDVCQEKYGNEMVAIMGPSAKYNTANKEALNKLPWTPDERSMILQQFNELASIPNYPGAYIIGRYTSFAFLSAYNEGADPTQAILSYIYTINKEITRKRAEFGLETLEQGETLAQRRLGQAAAAAEEIRARGSKCVDGCKGEDECKGGCKYIDYHVYEIDGVKYTAAELANMVADAVLSKDPVSLNNLAAKLNTFFTDAELNGEKNADGKTVGGLAHNTDIRINKDPDIQNKTLFGKKELVYYTMVAIQSAANALASY